MVEHGLGIFLGRSSRLFECLRESKGGFVPVNQEFEMRERHRNSLRNSRADARLSLTSCEAAHFIGVHRQQRVVALKLALVFAVPA